MPKKVDSGLPKAHKANAQLPKTTMQANNFEEMAQFLAAERHGTVLRYRVVGSQLIVLFVDGRKYYIDIV